MNSRGELAGIEALGEVIIGADFQSDDAGRVVAVRGEHDDGNGGHGADFAENFEAAHAGKHHVEDDEGIGAGERAAEAGAAAVAGRRKEQRDPDEARAGGKPSHSVIASAMTDAIDVRCWAVLTGCGARGRRN